VTHAQPPETGEAGRLIKPSKLAPAVLARGTSVDEDGDMPTQQAGSVNLEESDPVDRYCHVVDDLHVSEWR
jgi:hypothetical protein